MAKANWLANRHWPFRKTKSFKSKFSNKSIVELIQATIGSEAFAEKDQEFSTEHEESSENNQKIVRDLMAVEKFFNDMANCDRKDHFDVINNLKMKFAAEGDEQSKDEIDEQLKDINDIASSSEVKSVPSQSRGAQTRRADCGENGQSQKFGLKPSQDEVELGAMNLKTNFNIC